MFEKAFSEPHTRPLYVEELNGVQRVNGPVTQGLSIRDKSFVTHVKRSLKDDRSLA